MTKFILTVIFAFTITLFLSAQSVLWKDISNQKAEKQQIFPESYRSMVIDFELLKSQLLAAPAEGKGLRDSDYSIQLPTPNGGFTDFKIVEESVMAPELQVRYPNIRTYIGIGTGDYANATINLDFTLKGFHAQVLMEGKSYYIDPMSSDDLNTYIVYTRESFFKTNTKEMSLCEPKDIGVPQPSNNLPGHKLSEPVQVNFPQGSNGTELRTYRLALACTGEYAQYHGGTKPLVLSAMTTTMSRVNGIYRSDLCLKMELVSNNDELIFLDPQTDQYSNNNGVAMLAENKSKINSVIGLSNYDIGHVFSTGGGGVAYLGVVCNNSYKAAGVTGLPNPVGDPFDVEYVSHEMGHQWGAEHTFNNSCSGNRNSSTAYEPGSGSTIMSYAGICTPNIQNDADAYFHNHSYNEIRTFSVTGGGNSCATISASLNQPPIVTVPPSGFSIPKSTPFELTASATDPNNDAMTYCWEQYNLGPATAIGDNNLTNPSGNAPIFRSWTPTSEPTRVFPRISDLVSNTTVIGEHLPTYARNLTFKCTVRDAYVYGAVNDAQISFAVASNSGPFLVTSPNTSTTWSVGSTQTVTWNVANTTASPVSCSAVDIYLSTDGGYTYPTLLLSNASNNGSATITVPNNITTQARIKVKASSNIFFDISNQNFSIVANLPPVNDAICDAITIKCGDNLSGSTVGASQSGLGTPSCAAGTDKDVFYKFNATQGNTYTIAVTGTNYDGVLAIFSGSSCSSTLTELACSDIGVGSGTIETLTYTAVENGQIFIQTYDWFSNGGDFNITLYCEFVNDNPCDAIEITCGQILTGSTVGATQSSVGSPSCSAGSHKDIFYKIEAIQGVQYTVTVSGANYDGVLAAYSGSCSGTLTELDCSDAIGDGALETINFSVGSNQTVYVQTYDWFINGAEFELTLTCANVPYDKPCEARTLTCGESFSGSSAGATLSSVGHPTCADGSQKDVFFKFTALANVNYSVTVNGDNYDGVIAAYTGSCSGTLTQIACADNGFSEGIAETINISVSTDQVIIIQTYDYFYNGQSDFTITLNCPIPSNDECADAITLSVNNAGACPANQVVGTTYGSTASSPVACEPNSPDVYYSFNSGSNTEVIINLSNVTSNDLALSVFASNCSTPSIFCAFGTNQSPTISVSPSTTYYVRVHSFSNVHTGSFNICVEKVAPEIATINGIIAGWNSDCGERDATVKLYELGTATTVESYDVSIQSDGSFSIPELEIGTFDVIVKVVGYLAIGIRNVEIVAGDNSLSIGPIINGNMNNDGAVNITDFSSFAPAFTSVVGDVNYNPLADLDCNGAVNITDFSIFVTGFSKVGDTAPLLPD